MVTNQNIINLHLLYHHQRRNEVRIGQDKTNYQVRNEVITMLKENNACTPPSNGSVFQPNIKFQSYISNLYIF